MECLHDFSMLAHKRVSLYPKHTSSPAVFLSQRQLQIFQRLVDFFYSSWILLLSLPQVSITPSSKFLTQLAFPSLSSCRHAKTLDVTTVIPLSVIPLSVVGT